VYVLVSVCVSVWYEAEGSVSSNLGQTTDGKVSLVVKLRDRDTRAPTHLCDKDTEKHIYRHMEKESHKRRYL